jgi:hypothetical protein
VIIFAATMVSLYLSSTIYHAFTANQNQTALSPVRSLGDLSSHCRYLHTVRARSTAWCLGLDTF